MLALRQVLKISFRTFSSEIKKNPIEVRIPVPWGEVRGKWWGPTGVRPVLTVHGWQIFKNTGPGIDSGTRNGTVQGIIHTQLERNFFSAQDEDRTKYGSRSGWNKPSVSPLYKQKFKDNCGTFDRLIPLLNPSTSFLAIDLPGHGFSSRLPLGVYYHISNYLLTLKYIIHYFQWDKVSLMGHSMGGITSYTYTMLFPDRVDFLVCMDGSKPLSYKKVKYMSRAVEKFIRSNEFAGRTDEPPSYSLEEIQRRVHGPNNGSVDLQCAKYLMERNIAPSKEEGKFYFTRDPRLKLGEILSINQSELVEHAHNMTTPMFITKCKKSEYLEPKEHFYEVIDVLKRTSRDCSFHYVEGTHHAHLNEPAETAGLVREFMQRHDVEDRSGQGLKDDMIVREDDDERLKRKLVL